MPAVPGSVRGNLFRTSPGRHAATQGWEGTYDKISQTDCITVAQRNRFERSFAYQLPVNPTLRGTSANGGLSTCRPAVPRS
jgi:hypothetical protein